MSSRALRRLEKQKEQLADSGSDSEPENPPKKAFNAFAVLGGDEESGGESGDNSEAEETQKALEIPVERPRPTVASKKKKKKKARAKRQSKTAPQVEETSDLSDDNLDAMPQPEPDTYEAGDPDTEYDTENTLADNDNNWVNFTTRKFQASLALLSVRTSRALDPDHELKNLFGNLSQETIDDANSTSSLAISPEVLAQFKRLASLTRGWGGKDRRSVPGTTRKLLMTKIRDDWLPTHRKAMTMREMEEEEVLEVAMYKQDMGISGEDFQKRLARERKMGVKYFRFKKATTSEDRAADTQFLASVKIMSDHDRLIQQLQRHPYHVETLLQVAMILLRQGGDKATSNALVERCLFVFDRALHPKMHQLLWDGRSELIRLPYERYANRQFYLCLFRYIVALGERNLFLTALNYCRLLLGFSPGDDPVGVRYYLDFYAVLSEEYEYLIEFCSLPLVTCYENWSTPGIAFSTALAHFRLGQTQRAKNQLATAFSQHRHTAFKLAEQVQVDMKVKESDLDTSDREALETETYMLRSKLMWNDSPSIEFLRTELTKLWADYKPQTKGFFALWSKKQPRDQHISINLLRFAILSGEGALMSKIPAQVWDRETFEYDLFPPLGDHRVIDYLEDYVGDVSDLLVAQLTLDDLEE